MSLRARLALLCAAALAVALAAAGVFAYASERGSLGRELDAQLRARASQVTPDVVQQVLAANHLLPKQNRDGGGGHRGPTVLGFPDLELVTSAGQRALANPSEALTAIPADPSARAVAAGRSPPTFDTVQTPEGSLRIYVSRVAPGVAGEVDAPLAQVDASLDDLRTNFAIVGFAALVLVGFLASLVARRALRPVASLSRAAENVVQTGDLRERVAVTGRRQDELARLASTINAMLSALERSVGSQRQLVADASHELRTPLTSLITNLQLLDEPGGLNAGDARELVGRARQQADELAALVSDLVELARNSEVKLHLEEVRLDLVAAAALERVQGRFIDISFSSELSPWTVRGDAELLERAVGNMLDNAAKWSGDGGSVKLVADRGEVIVYDSGPGIAAADLPFVFDRFYRAAEARGQPGSGLGLAIVRQIAELHGGAATAASTEQGAALRLTVP